MEETQQVPQSNNERVDAPPKEPQFLMLALSYLQESPTNPRKSFDDLDDLAASIREKGVLQPIGVRRIIGATLRFEIVFGHRRFRAAAMAGLTAIPCVVLELDDRQTAEVQVIENLQRSDVHPLEEADGYAALIREHGYTHERLAAKIHRSAAYVRSRVMLAGLGAETRSAYLSDKITTGVAQLIARIPSEKQQDEATRELLTPDFTGEPRTVAYAGRWIRERYMLRLADAPFDRADAELVPEAGPCTTCSKRSGTQPELFADVSSPDTCTDTPCYRSKLDAHWKQLAKSAKKNGTRVLPDAEAKKLFPYGGGQLAYDAAYVSMADRAFDLGDGNKTYRELLEGHDVPITLVRDPSGNPREIIEKSALKAALKDAGVKSHSRRSAGSPQRAKPVFDERRAMINIAASRLVEFAEDPSSHRESVFLKLVAQAIFNLGEEHPEIAERLGWASKGEGVDRIEFGEHLDALSEEQVRGVIVEMIARSVGMYGPISTLTLALDAYAIDKSEIDAAVAEEKTKAVAAAKAKTKAKAKKGGKR